MIIREIRETKVFGSSGFKYYINKKLDKGSESLSPNTNSFLVFFIAFEWGRILRSAMDK